MRTGTDVMVTVAKSFDAPIKVVWPKDIMALVNAGLLNTPEGTKFSLLGLGDIVLPGIQRFLFTQQAFMWRSVSDSTVINTSRHPLEKRIQIRPVIPNRISTLV